MSKTANSGTSPNCAIHQAYQQAWAACAQALLNACVGVTQDDFYYRAQLRAHIQEDAAQVAHLRANYVGAKRADSDLVDAHFDGK